MLNSEENNFPLPPYQRPSTWGPLVSSLFFHAVFAGAAVLGYLYFPFDGTESFSPSASQEPMLVELVSIEESAVPETSLAQNPLSKPAAKQPPQALQNPDGEAAPRPAMAAPATASPVQAQKASAPLSGSAGQETYALQVARHIMKFRTYPTSARLRQTEGKVVLTISISAQGDLLSSRVKTSSGSHILDSAGLSAVRKAAPYPTPDETTAVFLDVPMNFRLREMPP